MAEPTINTLTLSDGREIPYPSDIDQNKLRDTVSTFLIGEVEKFDESDFDNMKPERLKELAGARLHQLGVNMGELSPTDQEEANFMAIQDPLYKKIEDAQVGKKFEAAKMGAVSAFRDIARSSQQLLMLAGNAISSGIVSDAELEEFNNKVKIEEEAFNESGIQDLPEFTTSKVATQVATVLQPMARAEQATNAMLQLTTGTIFKNPRLAQSVLGRATSAGASGAAVNQFITPQAPEDRMDNFVKEAALIGGGTAAVKVAQQMIQTGGPGGWWAWQKLNKALRQEYKIANETTTASKFTTAERDQMIKEMNEIGVEGTGYRVSQKLRTSVGKEIDDIVTSSTEGVDAVIINETRQMRNIADELDTLISPSAVKRSDIGLGNRVKVKLREAVNVANNVRKTAFSKVFGNDNPLLDEKIVNVTNLRQGMQTILNKYQSSLGQDMFKKVGKDVANITKRIEESPFISIRELQNDLSVFGEIASGVGKNTNQRTRIALAREIKKGLEKSLDDLIKRGSPLPNAEGRALAADLQRARGIYRHQSILLDRMNQGVLNKLLSKKTRGVSPNETVDNIMMEAPEKVLKRFRGLPQSEQEVVVASLGGTIGGGRLLHSMRASELDKAVNAARTVKGPNGMPLVDPTKLAKNLDDDLFKVLFKDEASKATLLKSTQALNTIVGRLGNMSRAAAGEVEQRLFLTGGSLATTGPASAGFAAALANKLYASVGSRMLLDSASREALQAAMTTKTLPQMMAAISVLLESADKPNTLPDVMEAWRK